MLATDPTVKKLTPTVQIQEEQLQATMGQANKGYELQEVQNSDNLRQAIYFYYFVSRDFLADL